jgi:hypothetical protein
MGLVQMFDLTGLVQNIFGLTGLAQNIFGLTGLLQSIFGLTGLVQLPFRHPSLGCPDVDHLHNDAPDSGY